MTGPRDVEVEVDSAQIHSPERVGRKLIAVIGIDRYQQWRTLTNAVRDALGALELFRRLGFDPLVDPLLDESATEKAIQSLVTHDLKELGPDDSLVLFYAGHGGTRTHRMGEKVVKTGCLIPFDASVSHDKITGWIDLEAWLREVSLSPAKHILVVLDACNSGIALNPLVKWRDSGTLQDEALATLSNRRSRRIIASALDDQIALDSGPIYGHSLFTGCLIEGLTHGFPGGANRVTTGSALGLYLQQRVTTYPSSQQTPDFGTFMFDERGEMVIPFAASLLRKAVETIALPPPPGSRPREEPGGASDSGVYIGWMDRPAEVEAALEGAMAANASASWPARRLPLGVKASIALGVVAAVVAGVRVFAPRIARLRAPPPISHKIVVGVNDFGGAYPGIVANDGATPGPRSLFSRAGLDVEIKLIRGSEERLEAFRQGQLDIMLLTLDYLANKAPDYRDKNMEVKAFLMVDWSRGNLGIVAIPKITSIEGLKDARVATTMGTPTHYMLLTLLNMSNLGPDDIASVKSRIVPATTTPHAGDLFSRGKDADAVAIWEPHLSNAIAGGKGHLLVSTATAANLIADVLYARTSFLQGHEAEMIKFVRVWLEGVELLRRDREGSIRTIAGAFRQSVDDTRRVLGKIKPATFADNREFFGLEKKDDAPFFRLFNEAARFWKAEGVIKTTPVDAASARWVRPLEQLSGEHRAEPIQESFTFDNCAKSSSPALLTRSVSIRFKPGDAELDSTARKRIDEFAETLTRFGNACVRVEGNTDSIGTAAQNKQLSDRRALAVVDHLAIRFGRARFHWVGNGATRPVSSNSTDEGRDANRRTDFMLSSNE